MTPQDGSKPIKGSSPKSGPPLPRMQIPKNPAMTQRQPVSRMIPMAGVPPLGPTSTTSNDIGLGVAVSAGSGDGGTVTARKAGGLRDLGFEVSPQTIGIRAALQHLAKAINIAFQSDYGENYLEAVYQAAIVRKGEVLIVHREFFGYRDNWFGQFGRLLEAMSLSLEGPDPASPEGRQRFLDKGPASIRGLFNLIGRKLDLVAEFEDRVPAYVEQMLDRLEASGIIVGWDREDWNITTTTIGLDVRITPNMKPTVIE